MGYKTKCNRGPNGGGKILWGQVMFLSCLLNIRIYERSWDNNPKVVGANQAPTTERWEADLPVNVSKLIPNSSISSFSYFMQYPQNIPTVPFTALTISANI